jgi:hypothetical protein
MYSKDQKTYFATINHDYDSFSATKFPSVASSKSYLTSSRKQEAEINTNTTSITNSTTYDTKDKLFKVKIIVTMEDKKNAIKIKIVTMLKGQIKSEMVNFQKKLKKIKGYTD